MNESGADDIEALLNKLVDVGVMILTHNDVKDGKTLPHVDKIAQYREALRMQQRQQIPEIAQSITNLLETERERVLEILNKTTIERRFDPLTGGTIDLIDKREVIERLGGASSRSLRSVNSSPETNLNNGGAQHGQ